MPRTDLVVLAWHQLARRGSDPDFSTRFPESWLTGQPGLCYTTPCSDAAVVW